MLLPMAEESDLERTEPASQRRLQEARDRGQIPRSPELTTFAVLLTAGAVLVYTGSGLMHGLLDLVRRGLTLDRDAVFRTDVMGARLFEGFYAALVSLSPLFIAVVIIAIAAPLLMSGWLFSWTPLQPNFAKLNPWAGIARLHSTRGLVELTKAMLKALVIGGVAVIVIWARREEFLGLLREPLVPALGHVGNLVGFTFLVIVAAMGIIVAVDVPYQLWAYHRDLRMTKEEIKQEAKESEGNPQVKSRVRAIQRETARRRMMAEVPKADVVVTNPTKFAVALRYRDQAMRAPQVVAKGSMELAERIREVAAEAGVPILRAPPLARALYRHTEIGQEIPAALYTAVAEVLAYVFQLRRYEASGGEAPVAPANIPVPADMDPEQTAR
jgi:flagellar biosynthesis protein FlhB